jgi:hypothetical protein
MRSWMHGVLSLCVVTWLGCSTQAAIKNPCPQSVAVGQTVSCQCSSGGSGAQTCQNDSTLSECQCAAVALAADGGGNNGGSGSAGQDAASHAADAAAQIDAGNPDAGPMQDASVDAGRPKPPSDGTQGAACSPRYPCRSGLSCYLPSGATVGLCTIGCTITSACARLPIPSGAPAGSGAQGASYTCSSNSPFVTGSCRISCSSAGDSSCPTGMSCKQTAAATATSAAVNECVYDPKSLGMGDVQLWDKCDTSGDCKGDHVCFGRGTMLIAGTTYTGFCTQACSQSSECTKLPPSGNVTPTCGADGKCMLDCTGGGQCPTGMTCISDVGLNGALRCVYTK